MCQGDFGFDQALLSRASVKDRISKKCSNNGATLSSSDDDDDDDDEEEEEEEEEEAAAAVRGKGSPGVKVMLNVNASMSDLKEANQALNVLFEPLKAKVRDHFAGSGLAKERKQALKDLNDVRDCMEDKMKDPQILAKMSVAIDNVGKEV